jgi:hypothetical protein
MDPAAVKRHPGPALQGDAEQLAGPRRSLPSERAGITGQQLLHGGEDFGRGLSRRAMPAAIGQCPKSFRQKEIPNPVDRTRRDPEDAANLSRRATLGQSQNHGGSIPLVSRRAAATPPTKNLLLMPAQSEYLAAHGATSWLRVRTRQRLVLSTKGQSRFATRTYRMFSDSKDAI